jgi:hypothetical protein
MHIPSAKPAYQNKVNHNKNQNLKRIVTTSNKISLTPQHAKKKEAFYFNIFHFIIIF